jgi:hypothetical protein
VVGATGYGPGELPAQSVRGLSVERGRAARLKLDLTHTQVPIAQLYEAEAFIRSNIQLKLSAVDMFVLCKYAVWLMSLI